MVGFSTHPASPDSNGTLQDNGGDGGPTRYAHNFSFFFSYILTTSYRAKNMPTWACFLFSAAVHTSLTPSYPATPNPTSPLLRTPKMCPHGRVFVVCRLSSTRKAETRPWGRVSAFRWLPSFPHHANTGNASTGTCFDVGWLLPHPTSLTPSPTYHSDQIPLGTAQNPIGIARNC